MDMQDREICNCEICGKLISYYNSQTIETPVGYFGIICDYCKNELTNVIRLKIKELKKSK